MPALKIRETGRQGVMRACLDLLEAEKIRHWRMNAGDRFGSYKGKKWRIRGHAKGTPDILVINTRRDIANWPDSQVLWIECKATGKHPTAEQLQFADEARQNGENHMFVDDPQQLIEWLRENRAR